MEAAEPVGNYAVKPTFSDGHDSGIFSWDYLYFLGSRQDELWAEYDGGDHTIAVARVLDLGAHPDRRPLLYHRGSYGLLRSSESQVAPKVSPSIHESARRWASRA